MLAQIQKKHAAIILLIVALSLFINGWFFFQTKNLISNVENSVALQRKYPYLAKRILQESKNDVLINFLPLREELRKEADPYGDRFAFYFEYLPTGVSIGINEKQEFHAASLLKLPVVMAYYKHKEKVKRNDDPVVTIQKEDLDSRFGSLWQRGEGTKINLADAARIAITNSDNTAAKILGHNIDKEDFDDVYEALDIDLRLSTEGAIITAKHYSSILKALYFAAVLSKDNSQKILEFMTQSKFNDKLTAGVPDDVTVAHKIGVIDNNTYSDCGIVYVPRRQYLLCMVSNSSENEASQRMSKVSQLIYDYVSKTER